MLTASKGSAVAICARTTPLRFRNSRRAAGTMLKLAAMGVSNVPQKPDSIPIALIAAALP